MVGGEETVKVCQIQLGPEASHIAVQGAVRSVLSAIASTTSGQVPQRFAPSLKLRRGELGKFGASQPCVVQNAVLESGLGVPTVLTSKCDAQGRFESDQVADETFNVQTLIAWQVVGRQQGANLMEMVTVSGGRAVAVVLAD